MSIMLSNYIESNHYKPAAPSWARLERYEYCEPFNKRAGQTKRSIFSLRSGKKPNKK